ncbi:MAG: hypothetical protein KAV87_08680, partial [Desulfobacteraceae bacterium]|nr:hypothetical protein [Desulfobacteraceae bacterium]
MRNLKQIYGPLLVAALLSLLVISCAKERKEPEGVRIKYDKSVRAITLKGKVLQSFDVNFAKDLDKESVMKMAKQLTDASGKSLSLRFLADIEEGVAVLRNERDPSASFEMDKRSGSFLYNGGLADYKKDASTPNLIAREKAESMALQHLEKLGLLLDKEELKHAHTGGLGMAVLKEDGSTEKYDKLVTVRYDRILSGLPVMGASRIVVHMGENGKLAGLIFNWGEVTEGKKIESDLLLADEEIKRALEGRLMAAARDAKRIIVEKADLVLYDDGKGKMEPAYHVEARLFYEAPGEKGQGEIREYDVPYDYYVSVLKKP